MSAPVAMSPARPPFVPLVAAARTADFVGEVEVLDVRPDVARSIMSLHVIESLRAADGLELSNRPDAVVSCRFGGWQPPVGWRGFVFLHRDRSADVGSVGEFALLHATVSRRSVLRALAGLEPALPQPDVDALVSLIDDCDLVVRGVAVTTSPVTARLSVIRVVKGQLSTTSVTDGAARPMIDVERGFEIDDPGGAWEFDSGPIATGVGIGEYYFMRVRDGRHFVMNPVEPGTVSDADVLTAIRRALPPEN